MTTTVQNTPNKVKFRQDVLAVEQGLKNKVALGELTSGNSNDSLKHYFSPIDAKYGCCTYAREILLQKGNLVIGKIHRHQHLNIISKGRVTVFTEFGKKELEGPCTFVSEVGLKRAVYAHEDTMWTTIHLTAHVGEENLDKIEDEIIASNYSDIGLIESINDLIDITGEKL
jgi:hypothetical protein